MPRQIICTTDSKKLRDSLISKTSIRPSAQSLYLGLNQELAKTCTTSLSPNQYSQCLGREFDYVIFDISGHSGFRFQSLLALSGTVKASGVLFIIEPIPNSNVWTGISVNYPLQSQKVSSSLWQYLKQHIDTIFYHQDVDKLMSFDAVTSQESLQLKNQFSRAISEQNDTLHSILDYLERDLKNEKNIVITANRGRGKSHLLARLAFQLLNSEHKILCIQQRNNDDQVLKNTLEYLSQNSIFLNQCIQIGSGKIAFTSTDSPLLQETWDTIIIDEAASYSLSVLKRLSTLDGIKIYSSTTHGYEGTGQGFKRIFVEQLPSYFQVELSTAFRFQIPCPIELAFTLNPVNTVQLADGFHKIKHEHDVILACYSLLSEAHYQSRPDDLQRLFDCPNTHCIVYVEQAKICGVCIYFEEKLKDISDELKNDILSGERRVQGHLGLQQIAHTYRCKKILQQTHWRINRIAVKTEKRRQGIGSQLVHYLLDMSSEANAHVTSSFSFQKHVHTFWECNGFVIVRFGQQANTATGVNNVLVIHNKNNLLLQELEPLITLQCHWGLAKPISQDLIQQLHSYKNTLCEMLNDFKAGKRHFDHTQYVLYGLHMMNILESSTLTFWFNNLDMNVKKRYQLLKCHGKAELIKQVKEEV